MATLCWVTSGDRVGPEGKPLKSLKKDLTALGFAHCDAAFPSGSTPAGWLNTALGSETQAVVVLDPVSGWVKVFVELLRKHSSPAVGFLPVIWMGAVEGQAGFESIAALGVNDQVLESINAAEFVGRLKFRSRDMAERMRLDAERQAHAMRDAKSETILKQREEFLSVCAHDLRSPLGLIQSCITMILNAKDAQANLSKLHLDLLDRAKRQAGQGITLVNDLLDVMAYEQGLKPQYQLLKLDDFLKEFHKDLAFQAQQKGVTFLYQNAVADWRVLFDSDRIRQLLQNLVTNAIKFTDQGKHITLSVNSFQGRRKADPKFPMVVVTIKDEGKGIPKKDLEKIFDRFTQVKENNRAEGRGLGLTVAKQISNLHDGNIWVESREGEGSTFYVLFPHVVSGALATGDIKRTKPTCIVAEPNELKQTTHYQTLKEAGNEVFFSADGIGVLEQAFYQRPDAIYLTSGLKKMNEIEVANILKGDVLTSSIPLFLINETGTLTKKEHSRYFTAILKFPLTGTKTKKTA